MTQRVQYLVGPEAVSLVREDVPVAGPGEVLLAVEAALTCGTDVKVFRRGGHPRMLVVPSPFGHEVCGVIAATGEGVASWRVGDRVVVANSAPCARCRYCRAGRENLCLDLLYLNGAFADHLLVPERFVERSLHRVPEGLPPEVAAMAEPLACVLHGVEACDLSARADVLIAGGGPIGLLFVGSLASRGHRVTVADPNPGRLEVARRLGAAGAVEIPRGGGQAKRLSEASEDGAGYDVAIDASGVPAVWTDVISSVRPGGTANLFGGCAPGTTVPLDTHAVHYREITIKGVYHHRPETFRAALSELAEGRFDARLLLSEERPLEDVEGALRAMIAKHALKVVIRPGA